MKRSADEVLLNSYSMALRLILQPHLNSYYFFYHFKDLFVNLWVSFKPKTGDMHRDDGVADRLR